MFSALCSITTVKVAEQVPFFFRSCFFFFKMSTSILARLRDFPATRTLGSEQLQLAKQTEA